MVITSLASPIFSNSHSTCLAHIRVHSSDFSRFFQPSLYSNSNLKLCSLSNRFSSFLSAAIHIDTERINQSTYSAPLSFYDQSSITIIKCKFLKCVSQNPKGGGAVFCRGVSGELISKENGFVECFARQPYASGGAFCFLDGIANITHERNCYRWCSSSMNGQAMHFRSVLSGLYLNYVSTSDCPDSKMSLQTAALSVTTKCELYNLNITNGVGFDNPTIALRCPKVIAINDITFINNTCDKTGSIYYIAIHHDLSPITFHRWNLVGCYGKMNYIGLFSVGDELIQRECVFVKGPEKWIFMAACGDVSIVDCVADNPFEGKSNPQARIDVSRSKVSSNPILRKLSIVHLPACAHQAPNGSPSFLIPSSIMVKPLFISIGIVVFACLVGILISKILKNREEKYIELDVPDILGDEFFDVDQK